MNLLGFKKKIGLTLIISSMLLSGCSFMPETEEVRVAPVAQSLEQVYFEQVEVTKESISSKFEMIANYKTKKIQSMCFEVDNVIVANTYFEVGDTVKEGDILVEADSTSLKESIDYYISEISEREKTIAYYEKLVEIEEGRKNIYAQYGITYDDTNLVSYQETVDSETKLLNVSKIQLDEAYKKLDQIRIYAPFDGTVTYIVEPNRWQTLRRSDIAATVVQSDERIYSSSTLNDYIEVGGIYSCEVTTEKYEYTDNSNENPFANVEVKTITDTFFIEVKCISIECVNEESGNYEYIFTAVDPSLIADVDNIPQCKIVVLLETVEGATVLPKDVLIKTSEGHAVYLQAEDGSRTIQNVEVGIIEGNKAQIISGLEPGQIVIGNKITEENGKEANKK